MNMKRHLLTLLSLLYLISCSQNRSQDPEPQIATIEQYYASRQLAKVYEALPDSTFHGNYKAYHRTGQLAAEGKYQLGKRKGRWCDYHYTGQLMAEHHYQDNQKHGAYRWYYENGGLKQMGYYQDGHLLGSVWSYYPEGALWAIFDYDAHSGKRKREWQYDKNGQLTRFLYNNDRGGEVLSIWFDEASAVASSRGYLLAAHQLDRALLFRKQVCSLVGEIAKPPSWQAEIIVVKEGPLGMDSTLINLPANQQHFTYEKRIHPPVKSRLVLYSRIFHLDWPEGIRDTVIMVIDPERGEVVYL